MNAGVGAGKKFQCHRCERRFARREHLQRHERSHTKEKPFACSICAGSFTRRDLLVRHSRLTHGSPGAGVRSTRAGAVSIPSPTPSQTSPSLEGVNANFQAIAAFEPENGSQSTFATPRVEQEIQCSPSSTYPSLELEVSAWHATTGSIDGVVPSSTATINTADSESWLRASSFDADFSSFLDSIALPAHQYSNYFPLDQPLPYFSPDPVPATPSVGNQTNNDFVENLNAQRRNTRDSLTQFGSRLPSLQPEDHQNDTTPPPAPPRKARLFTNVSVEDRAAVVSKLAEFQNVIPTDFKLGSRHALSRYMTGFVAGFHDHLPFLHLPTMALETAALELILAMAAIGAHYCRESETGLAIFRVAKAVCEERIGRLDQKGLRSPESSARRASFGSRRESVAEVIEGSVAETPSYHEDPDYKPIQTTQALLVLMAMATWFERRPPAREAPAIRSLLETLVRDEGLRSEPINPGAPWEEWIEYEGKKRTKFVVFCFFNLHSIVFDIPPMILSSKIDMDLPCSETEWKAQDANSWREARKQHLRAEPRFLSTFHSLFKGRAADGTARLTYSTLGSYVLIHAVIQYIWLTQELYRNQKWQLQQIPDEGGGHLHSTDISSLEIALKSWQYSWERNPESSVDPLSPHGPLSFNSTALLRLAYIRINIDTGPIRSLGSCNPTAIATSIFASPPIQRSKRMTRAALHSAHALSIPIKLGINSIAHTRLFWSIQHAICSLECALLLTKWLQAVTKCDLNLELHEAERKLLAFVLEMVAETEFAASTGDLLRDDRRLSAVVVRVWARLFRQDDIWEMVTVIGRSLVLYANMLDSGVGG